MFFITVSKDNKLDYSRTSFEGYLVGLRPGTYFVRVDRANTRTAQQNRLYWAWLRVIAESTGDDENSLHEVFKRMFLPPKFVTYRGKEVKMPRSTTELNTGEFTDYLMRVEKEAGELNVILPQPPLKLN